MLASVDASIFPSGDHAKLVTPYGKPANTSPTFSPAVFKKKITPWSSPKESHLLSGDHAIHLTGAECPLLHCHVPVLPFHSLTAPPICEEASHRPSGDHAICVMPESPSASLLRNLNPSGIELSSWLIAILKSLFVSKARSLTSGEGDKRFG